MNGEIIVICCRIVGSSFPGHAHLHLKSPYVGIYLIDFRRRYNLVLVTGVELSADTKLAICAFTWKPERLVLHLLSDSCRRTVEVGRLLEGFSFGNSSSSSTR